MDTVAVYVGLDYHDESVQVCVLDRRTAGKPGSVVAAAVANRYVRALYHQMLAA